MKIEIEFESSYEADITIDGRTLKYGYQNGSWSFMSTLSAADADTTIGGMVASRISYILIEILQHWMPESENPEGEMWGTWETLDEDTADELYQHLC